MSNTIDDITKNVAVPTTGKDGKKTIPNFQVLSENDDATVVACYEKEEDKMSDYQTEAQLENALLEQLQQQMYQRVYITTEEELILNLRKQIENLNGIRFTDAEWKRFFDTEIAKKNDGIEEKTITIQEDYRKAFTFDDNTQRNIALIKKDNIHENNLQVLNQYTPEGGAYDNRYDVTILVNGLPLVHIELKKRGIDIREAFNQINRYQNDSFWAGSGLYEYIQIFIISNGTYTKYYSNTTRDSHINELKNRGKQKKRTTSNSYEFTSWWTDARNKPITGLIDFTKTFLSKHTLLNILTRYCVFTTEKILMVMRPYQIAATERIIRRINTAYNYHWEGTLKAGGYVWHTTGSGKTLTSFKTARLLSHLDIVNKVLFVVDRKDLDYQTMKEYDKFERGAANGNTSTEILRRQLKNSQCRIIITTIQKLSILLSAKDIDPELRTVLQQHRIVIIFDECHRSQFGEMHRQIIKKIKKYFIFGFTGTPIFPENAGATALPTLKTTEQAFGDQLHRYTIVDAIRDKNVLPFRVEYISTVKSKKDIEDMSVWSIDKEAALLAPERIHNITEYILQHFNQKTKRNAKAYTFKRIENVEAVAAAKTYKDAEEVKKAIRLTGFNSIFAVSSITAARLYYAEFKKQMALLPEEKRLRVATIFSYGVNQETDGLEDENSDDTSLLSGDDRAFLESAISDYNGIFQTSYDTTSEKFANYYKDVSLRMKNREIDILIVVNMFLTGFDATTVNTLWVDKNLRLHGLIQAFSRTNRILNSIKTFGNIVCFRDLEKNTEQAISLFGDKDSCGIVLIKTFEEYYNGYSDPETGKHIKGYKEIVEELLGRFEPGTVLASEQEKRIFVKMFSQILRLTNILDAFDDFEPLKLLNEHQMQQYRSMYIDIHEEIKSVKNHDKEDITDDLVFEMELIKQVEINIDYILTLVRKYHESHTADKELALKDIDRAIKSSVEMRKKKELIDQFVMQLTPENSIDDTWNTFVRQKYEQDIEELIQEFKLNEELTKKFMAKMLKQGYVEQTGTDAAAILPKMSPFGKNNKRGEIKAKVMQRIQELFDKYADIYTPI